MNKRQFLTLMIAAGAVSGCARWPRNTNRAASEGIIVRPEPQPVAGMMELVPAGQSVFISGTINDDAVVALEAVRAANPEITQAVFIDADGPTGSPAGIALGRALRTAGMTTHLRNDSRVSGAAIDAFLGGTRRTLEDGAMVGAVRRRGEDEVHTAYVSEMTGGDGYARYVAEFGGVRRPRAMTIAEIGAMGLISRPGDNVLAEG